MTVGCAANIFCLLEGFRTGISSSITLVLSEAVVAEEAYCKLHFSVEMTLRKISNDNLRPAAPVQQKPGSSCLKKKCMKQLLYCCALLLLTQAVSCNKSKDPLPFDWTPLLGKWVPYEFKHSDGTVETGPFTAMSLFAAYNESVWIKEDRTFIPMAWYSASQIFFNDFDKGPVVYNDGDRKILFQAGFSFEGTVVKLEASQLWIQNDHVLYKFRKEN